MGVHVVRQGAPQEHQVSRAWAPSLPRPPPSPRAALPPPRPRAAAACRRKATAGAARAHGSTRSVANAAMPEPPARDPRAASPKPRASVTAAFLGGLRAIAHSRRAGSPEHRGPKQTTCYANARRPPRRAPCALGALARAARR
eukprot:363550-Chlamydomonas_euryale.AAC.7